MAGDLESGSKPLLTGLELCSLATAGTQEEGVGVVEITLCQEGQGLGGSAPLLVRFLGASEKMNGIWGLGVSPSKQKKGRKPFFKSLLPIPQEWLDTFLSVSNHY